MEENKTPQLDFEIVPFTDDVWRTLNFNDYLKRSKDPIPAEKYYEMLVTGKAYLAISKKYPGDFLIFSLTPPANSEMYVYAFRSKDGNVYDESFKMFLVQMNIKTLRWSSYRKAWLNPKRLRSKNVEDYKVESATFVMHI